MQKFHDIHQSHKYCAMQIKSGASFDELRIVELVAFTLPRKSKPRKLSWKNSIFAFQHHLSTKSFFLEVSWVNVCVISYYKIITFVSPIFDIQTFLKSLSLGSQKIQLYDCLVQQLPFDGTLRYNSLCMSWRPNPILPLCNNVLLS